MADVTTADIQKFTAWVRAFDGVETPRLYARRLRHDDAEALFDAMHSPRVNRWISGFAQPFDLSAMRRWLAKRIERMDNGEGIYGGVFYRGSNVMLGFMHMVMEPELGGIEIAGATSELYWGKGFVEEFSYALINDTFNAGLTSIVATCAIENWPSMRVMQTLNFEKVGQVPIDTPQGPRPSWLWRLTPELWRDVHILPLGDGLTTNEIRERRKAVQALCREMKSARDYVDPANA